MSLTRLTPTLSPLFRMLAEDPLFTRLAAPVFGELASRPAMGMRVPALDVKEQGDKWVVEAEVPGVKGKDIDLSLTDNTLTIRGSLEQERTTEPPASSEQQGESKQPSYWSSERIYGSFSRSFAFPTAVDAEGVKARLENGVLKVEVPKRAQEEGGKKITVEEIQA